MSETDTMKHSAVIIDLDGTLAAFKPELFQHLHQDGDALPTAKEHNNIAPMIEGIYKLANQLQKIGEKILLFSSLPASHYHASLEWMLNNNIAFDAIYWPTSQAAKLPYEECKQSIVARIKADGYEPWLVLDEQEHVTRSWKKYGLEWLHPSPSAS
ncbi:polynucleotide kinase [Marinomonas ostreistagni]|uniref:phosphatase domain-containing protein n=1 Tax=Marinomonas ostreistagni TaxID=359209 RepID=UPI00194F373D|nr:polynucleotide kinase [Marinomonas ostreistagni]MBM6550343.1 polynucleotide kinase [Marinomonas ostreistagni]